MTMLRSSVVRCILSLSVLALLADLGGCHRERSAPAELAQVPTGCRRSQDYQRARLQENLDDFDAFDWTRSASGIQDADLDGDARADALSVIESRSSNYFQLELRLSSLPQPVQMAASIANTQFVTALPVPEALLDPRLERARAAVAGVLARVVCSSPDPSLEWLLRGAAQLRWYPGLPSFPEVYALYTTDAGWIRQWLDPEEESALAQPPAAAWLIYLGYNHRRSRERFDSAGGAGELSQFAQLATRAELQLLASAHGVVLYDSARQRHAWIYVHAGGQKLRHATIAAARFDGERARIEIDVSLGGEAGEVSVELATGRIATRICDVEAWRERRCEREDAGR